MKSLKEMLTEARQNIKYIIELTDTGEYLEDIPDEYKRSSENRISFSKIIDDSKLFNSETDAQRALDRLTDMGLSVEPVIRKVYVSIKVA